MKRKLAALLLALAMVFALAACAEEGTTTTDPPAPPHTVSAGGASVGSVGGSGGAASGIQAIAEFPALVTSGGQSADYQMIGTVMGKLGMDFTLNNLAKAEDLGDAKTLIVVVGGSSKGLGAAGIDADGELKRVGELIDAAKAKGLTVLAMHTGGSARRGDLSDKFIAPVFEQADYAIVVTSGDADGLMSGICAAKSIPMSGIASISEVASVLPAVFTGGAGEQAASGEAIAEFPALVTSGGQSADYQMIGTVMGKLGMDFTLNNLAKPEDLGDAKTLIVVVGGSSKGLGAAGIDADGELKRVGELIDAAKSKGLTVIAMHTGGSARRGDLSDKFIAPVFEQADYAIVVASGDADGLMSGICSAKGIRLDTIQSISEVASILPAAFSGGASESPASSEAVAEFPALVTSGGQSADYQMIGTVMGKLGMDFTLNNLAKAEDLGEAKTLIVVVGGSSKGLGAAGIDADGELKRVGELIDAAKSKGLTVIAMHTGGSARRGDLSDKFIAPVFEQADYAIVVASGDADGLMSGICSAKGIRLDTIQSISEVASILPAAFR